MAQEAKREGREATDRPESVIDRIRAIAAHNARAELNSPHQLLLFLKSWWSTTYNRPLKDPLLETYTLEELLYEFFDKIERKRASVEKAKSEAVKMEQEKERAALDWAEEEERKELAELEALAKKDPTKDPDNIKWMKEQLALGKQTFGESFGEDIEEIFEE